MPPFSVSLIRGSIIVIQISVSYTHLDVYKRQAELNFNTVEGATHYVIHRESSDENSQTSTVREFTTKQTRFIDRSIDSSHAYTYTVKAMLGDRCV